jgi:hypothetical protein
MSASRSAYPVEVPGSVRGMALIDGCTYEDAFCITVVDSLGPGAWARLVVGAAPASLLRFIRVAQGSVLGLELGPEDSEHPLGWTILRDDADAFVLAAEGPGAVARIVGSTPPGQVVITTQTRFDSPRGRAVWRLVAPLHRRIARYLLDRAVESRSRAQAPVHSSKFT